MASAKKAKKFARKMGMKKQHSSKYKTAYYKGRKLKIGVNYVDPSVTRPFFYFENSGNKKVRFNGVKIGDTKDTVSRKVYGNFIKKKKNKYVSSYGGGFIFTWIFKNGRLSKWSYKASYTS